MNIGEIVKRLVAILDSGKVGEEYLEDVKLKLIGAKIRNGYEIKSVIGVGNLGTTVQAYDLQRNENVVLKIYHAKFAMNSALNEFKMLHNAQNAPSIVKVHSLIYNPKG